VSRAVFFVSSFDHFARGSGDRSQTDASILHHTDLCRSGIESSAAVYRFTPAGFSLVFAERWIETLVSLAWLSLRHSLVRLPRPVH
jgi:hypothetical protein